MCVKGLSRSFALAILRSQNKHTVCKHDAVGRQQASQRWERQARQQQPGFGRGVPEAGWPGFGRRRQSRANLLENGAAPPPSGTPPRGKGQGERATDLRALESSNDALCAFGQRGEGESRSWQTDPVLRCKCLKKRTQTPESISATLYARTSSPIHPHIDI